MFDNLLIPIDGSDGTERVFEHALDIAAAHDATLHILTVADTTRDSVTQIQGEVVDALEQEGEKLVREAADNATQHGVSIVTAVEQGEPYRTIVDYASARGIDLVIMPTHGRRGLSRLLLGSTTERVVRQSDVPVLTIRPDDSELTYPYEDILVPTDGSDCADAALALGAKLATVDDVTLHLLSVLNVMSLGLDVRANIRIDELREMATEIVAEAASYASDTGVESVMEAVDVGSSVHQSILSYIDDNGVDVIVIGTHGRTGFDRYLLGSVTEKLIRTSPVPVLTVRQEAEEV